VDCFARKNESMLNRRNIMKKLSIFLILLFATTAAKAQQAGQLFITSYDDTGEIVYICNGNTLNSITVGFGMLNLNSSVPLLIDSIIPHSNSTAFQQLWLQYDTLTLTDVSFGGNALFYPTQLGDDTIYETVYYNGQFSETGTIIFHARSSPDLSMFGYTVTTAYLVDGNGFGGTNQEEETDTMHDEMTNGIGGAAYYLGTATRENGGNQLGDQPVALYSCGGATIDSIYESGDFSEFAFDPFPTLPYTIPGDDSLVLNYEFTPKIIDEKDTAHHYLIFHSTDGHYLTWSFEYKVYPASSVSEAANTSIDIKAFPNPATDALQILGGQPGTIHLFDLMGRERMNANDDGTGATLDVSRLESGTYFLRLGSQSTKIEIAH
jgi:Secretion system C-terminal sorting domain